MVDGSILTAAGNAIHNKISTRNFLKKLEGLADLKPDQPEDREQIEFLYQYYEANSRYIERGHELVVLLQFKYNQIERANAEVTTRHLEQQLLSVTDELETAQKNNEELRTQLDGLKTVEADSARKDKCISELEAELEKRQDAVHELRATAEGAADAQTELAKVKVEITKQAQDIDDLKRELASAQNALSNALDALPLDEFIKVLKNKLPKVQASEFLSANHPELLELAVALDRSFEANGLHPPSHFMEIPDHLRHINATEAIIDHMTQAIQRVKTDEVLDEEERQTKLDHWQEILDRQIQELLGHK